MRIGLNALYLIPGEVGGTERYARRLIAELPLVAPNDELVIFSNREAAETWGPLPAQVRVHRCDVNARSRPARIAWEQTLLPFAARRERLDVLHSLGYTAPLLMSTPSVVTLHDLNYHFHPEDWGVGGLWANRLLIPAVATRADRILTISESSAAAIRDVLHVPPERIDVVYHGVDGNVAAATSAPVLGTGYLLSVTATHPHKNLTTLLAAYESLCASWPEAPQLVLVGVAGRDQARVESLARGKRVVMTGWLDDAALGALYGYAGAFVFTSRYEGFGFPVLEAMSVGVPVVSSRATSLAELCIDAALLRDPDDVAGFATDMRRVLVERELRTQLIQRGRARAATFTWRRAAEQTLAVYRRCI